MSRTVTAVKVGALALALGATNLSAQEARAVVNRAPAVEISARPYAGSWTGTFSLAAAPRDIPMTVQLSAVEGSLNTYSGETQVARAAAVANVPMSVPTTLRNMNPAMATGGPSSAPTGLESLDLSGVLRLVQVEDGPLMCDSARRCVDMPVAKWESKGFNGASWVYTAMLVDKDKIEGVISEAEDEGETPIAIFSLTRTN